MANLPITGAYCWLNTINGKRYVGGAYKSLKARRIAHTQALERGDHFNRHLQSAWNKYGKDAFKFIVLEICKRDKETITKCEQKWIDYYNSANDKYGYNICPNATTAMGRKYTEEQKAKNGAKLPSSRAKLRAANLGKKHSDKTKLKMKISNKGKREKLRGKPLTDEWRANLSAAAKKQFSDPKARRQMHIIKKLQYLMKKYKKEN
jgi:group I intron endonuclease